ncbi:MAG: GTP-binding protein, partial [Clostridia bacterium]|nr:GTP-binding protein [Clostridia bacterium]
MKRIVVGILAHVDSGKTTLSEGMLFAAGKIRRQGRVDHGDAYLDTDSIERERGITIFSKQAVFGFGDTEFTLLDTPGHVDFAAETERTLQVLDYAVLVISASDGVQPHTETLWRLLKRHRVPTFIFVNKMDLPDTFAEKILAELNKKLDEGCVDFGADKTSDEFADAAAMCSEELMEEYLETGAVSRRSLAEAVMRRRIFPCRFGSALSGEGVAEFLEELDRYTVEPPRGEKFGAKVFKISDGGRGVRLTYMKITGGVLRVKDIVDPELSEKVNEIRIYSGEKYDNVSEACAGTVCAVTGLSQSRPGQGYGTEQDSEGLMSEPIFSYTVNILDGTDNHTALQKLRRLEQEETQLFVSWDERNRKIGIRLMGE